MLDYMCYNRTTVKPKVVKVAHYSEYLTSELWKCSQSPTGAHYWLIVNQGMTCKYCSEIRLLKKYA